MNKPLILSIISLSILPGCANYFQEQSQDSTKLETRNSNDIWQDHQNVSAIAGLSNTPEFRGKARINATEDLGKITLMGQAIDQKTKDAAELFATQLPGIKAVSNQIRIQPLLTIDQISYDSWITTKVKTALIESHELDGLTIRVNTEDKEVFLSGIVTHANGELALGIATGIDGVNSVVNTFSYIN